MSVITMHFTLNEPYENAKPALPAGIELTDRGLGISFKGYGELSSEIECGTPVFIEIRDGVPHVLIWADINRDDPTHVISLEGAAENKRQDSN